MLQIGVVTRHDDFHAYVVRQLLEEQGIKCLLLFADSLSWVGRISWSSSWPAEEDSERGTLYDSEGGEVIVADLDVVWWRRLTGKSRIPVNLPKKGGVRSLVVNDCRAGLLGLLLTDFQGTWISPPEATRYASNKQLQLRVAQRAGLRVPRTLVSQDPDRVRAFCAASKGQIIVKSVAGSQKPLMTGLVRHEILTDEAIRVCPAIYQEFIPGNRHLRISCFGDALHAAMLETEALDWRYALDAHVTRFELDGNTACQIRRILTELGLRMGMVDMKLDDAGVPVWLEINPQGQFMFLEGMCDALPLSRSFCDFLIAEANRASQRRAPLRLIVNAGRSRSATRQACDDPERPP